MAWKAPHPHPRGTAQARKALSVSVVGLPLRHRARAFAARSEQRARRGKRQHLHAAAGPDYRSPELDFAEHRCISIRSRSSRLPPARLLRLGHTPLDHGVRRLVQTLFAAKRLDAQVFPANPVAGMMVLFPSRIPDRSSSSRTGGPVFTSGRNSALAAAPIRRAASADVRVFRCAFHISGPDQQPAGSRVA